LYAVPLNGDQSALERKAIEWLRAELLTPEGEVMAVEVTASPAFQTGTPRLLLKVPGSPADGGAQQWSNVSRDGHRFVFTVNVTVNWPPR